MSKVIDRVRGVYRRVDPEPVMFDYEAAVRDLERRASEAAGNGLYEVGLPVRSLLWASRLTYHNHVNVFKRLHDLTGLHFVLVRYNNDWADNKICVSGWAYRD
jgi:hypothetical protein